MIWQPRKDLSRVSVNIEDLRVLLEEAEQNLKDSGGCDHSVNICWCPVIRAVEEIRKTILESEAG